ncbi:zinc metalloprotease HtpX [Ferrimonas sp. YFM]|uniref:zinc metalloprotease HtpX n=1 Tax=Ferrimonas sp. YFM TaxID=3028878 RepID=UPI002572753B|nr:zinc metalloprotease HtpX [Ferrimonas sp. YFM]BDY05259.1 Zn-dependent protease [Ferrimonas sp. YFM]
MDPRQHLRSRLRNALHTLFLLGGMALLLMLSGHLLLGPGTEWLVLAMLIIVSVLLPTLPTQWQLRMMRVTPMTGAPGLKQAVAELARRAQLERSPQVFWSPSLTANAFAMGSQNNGVIVVSEGLLRRLSAPEIAGVLAHEVAHLAHSDAFLLRMAALITGLCRMLASLAWIGALIMLPLMLFGMASVSIGALLLLMVTPHLCALLQLALSRVREFDADRRAASLLGAPEPLASALLTISREQAPLWRGLLTPTGQGDPLAWLRSHPPTAERVEKLMALKAAQSPYAHNEHW